ncbi:MAG TPA: hypothetical protein PKH58_02210 [Paludibacteraceae bacterium]|nr:hypothetical protein [Paludibacteraceae bacterium]
MIAKFQLTLLFSVILIFYSNAQNTISTPQATNRENNSKLLRQTTGNEPDNSIKPNLNINSDFLHPQSRLIFPSRLNDFQRNRIIFTQNNPSKIDVIYYSADSGNEIAISLYRYETGTEGRLRNEYLNAIRKLTKEENVDSIPRAIPVKYKGLKYICNGVKGRYDFSETAHTELCVYECGTWMMNIKIRSKNLNSNELIELEKILTNTFDPSWLTSQNPLLLKSNVDFERSALADTVMTAAMVASAFKKLDWATYNVRANERASGFPDLYLNMHIASIREFIQIQQKKPRLYVSPSAEKYFKELSEINNAGFLPEFIMEQYQNIMFVPDGQVLNHEGYKKWKENKNLTIDLNRKMYTICYRKQ